MWVSVRCRSRVRERRAALLFGWVGGGCRDTRIFCKRARCTVPYVILASSTPDLVIDNTPHGRDESGQTELGARHRAADILTGPFAPACFLAAGATFYSKWPARGEPCSKKRSPGLDDGDCGVNAGDRHPGSFELRHGHFMLTATTHNSHVAARECHRSLDLKHSICAASGHSTGRVTPKFYLFPSAACTLVGRIEGHAIRADGTPHRPFSAALGPCSTVASARASSPSRFSRPTMTTSTMPFTAPEFYHPADLLLIHIETASLHPQRPPWLMQRQL